MHSVRRAILRSAASAASASRISAVSSATPLIRTVAAQNVFRPIAQNSAALATRYFSQTVRVANAEEQTPAEATAPATEAAAAPAEQKQQAQSDGDTPYGVFVRNMVFDATDEHLKQAFEHYGPVAKAVVVRDARGLSRGFGFVYFDTKEAMDAAIEEADGNFWHGRRLAVAPRTGKRSGGSGNRSNTNHSPSSSLYLGNLPFETTDADLNTMFRDIQGVKAVRVAVDNSTGWSRGFAHVDFNTVEEATAAFAVLGDYTLGSRKLRVDYATERKNTNFRRQQAQE